jgi:hypothetical protein
LLVVGSSDADAADVFSVAAASASTAAAKSKEDAGHREVEEEDNNDGNGTQAVEQVIKGNMCIHGFFIWRYCQIGISNYYCD